MKLDCSQLSSPHENDRLQIEHQRTDELITDMAIQAWVSTISLIVYHNHYGGNFRQKSYVVFLSTQTSYLWLLLHVNADITCIPCSL